MTKFAEAYLKATREREDPSTVDWQAVKASGFARSVIKDVVSRWEYTNYPQKLDATDHFGWSYDDKLMLPPEQVLMASRQAAVIWRGIIKQAGARCRSRDFVEAIKVIMVSDAWFRKNPDWEKAAPVRAEPPPAVSPRAVVPKSAEKLASQAARRERRKRERAERERAGLPTVAQLRQLYSRYRPM
jgi:hypothetical protein